MTAWERYWYQWLQEKLQPYKQQLAEQQQEYQKLQARATELERSLKEKKEQALVVDLWHDFLEDEEKSVLFTPPYIIHPALCEKEGCLKKRFRHRRCIEHYEYFLQEERFL